MAMFDGFDKVLVGLVSIGVGSRSVGGIVDGCMCSVVEEELAS